MLKMTCLFGGSSRLQQNIQAARTRESLLRDVQKDIEYVFVKEKKTGMEMKGMCVTGGENDIILDRSHTYIHTWRERL